VTAFASMTTAFGCGSVSVYGGAGNAAMPIEVDSMGGGGGVGNAAAAVGVVRLHIRITSS